MSKTEQYSANLLRITPFVTRNRANVQEIDKPSFWVNDVEQANGSNEIKVSISFEKNWLKFSQEHGESCTLFPVDGNDGVFKFPSPVKNEDDFLLPDGKKKAGGCDLIVVNDKCLFVEYKINVTSLNLKQINENRTKASLQLAKTLTSFQEQGVLLNGTNCKCMIVTPTYFPKKIVNPLAIKFFNKYNVPLEEKTIDDVVRI